MCIVVKEIVKQMSNLKCSVQIYFLRHLLWDEVEIDRIQADRQIIH